MSLLKEMEPLAEEKSRSVEGIPISLGGRDFLITKMDEEDNEKWTTARFMFYWRQLVVFRNIHATIVSSVNNYEELMDSKDSRNNKDDRCYELSAEWITLTNALVAMAFRFTEVSDVDFIKTLGYGDKNKVILIQDQLNGLDLLKKFQEIEKHRKSMEALNRAVEKSARSGNLPRKRRK